jgi:hypothetical protein
MINRSSLKTFTTILSPLACLELLSTAQSQERDLGGGNTNERLNALLKLSCGGSTMGLVLRVEARALTRIRKDLRRQPPLTRIGPRTFGKIRVESPSHPRRYRIRFQR